MTTVRTPQRAERGNGVADQNIIEEYAADSGSEPDEFPAETGMAIMDDVSASPPHPGAATQPLGSAETPPPRPTTESTSPGGISPGRKRRSYPTTGRHHRTPKITVSFSGGGWFQQYHFGVGQALRDAGVVPRDWEDAPNGEPVARYAGASAGALVAAAMAGGLDLHAMSEFGIACGEDWRRRRWRFSGMDRYVTESVQRFAREVMRYDAQTSTSTVQNWLAATLEVYVTTLPRCHALKLTRFRTLEDAEEALRASCCATPFAGFPFRLRRHGPPFPIVIDGGVAAFQPRAADSRTITVCPFYHLSADIRPSCYMPMHWMFFPPAPPQHRAIFDLGYNDCLDYLRRSQRITDRVLLRDLRRPDPKPILRSRPRASEMSYAAMLWFAVLLILKTLCRPVLIWILYLEMWIMIFYELTGAVAGLAFVAKDVVIHLAEQTMRRVQGKRRSSGLEEAIGKGIAQPSPLRGSRSWMAENSRSRTPSTSENTPSASASTRKASLQQLPAPQYIEEGSIESTEGSLPPPMMLPPSGASQKTGPLEFGGAAAVVSESEEDNEAHHEKHRRSDSQQGPSSGSIAGAGTSSDTGLTPPDRRRSVSFHPRLVRSTITSSGSFITEDQGAAGDAAVRTPEMQLAQQWRRLRRAYRTARNALSPRVLLRLWVGPRVRVNEERLHDCSPAYRFLSPFAF